MHSSLQRAARRARWVCGYVGRLGHVHPAHLFAPHEGCFLTGKEGSFRGVIRPCSISHGAHLFARQEGHIGAERSPGESPLTVREALVKVVRTGFHSTVKGRPLPLRVPLPLWLFSFFPHLFSLV